MSRKNRVGRRSAANPNHHLWNNNGTWFIHYTAYPSPITKERIRHSLQTANLRLARRRRDEVFRRIPVQFFAA
ncbi:MAG: hypothetical protein FJ388_24745 [Verrucomicrobia bacterium]|nr:hypothetical protein [Verrucomicrobiota bacterium]